MRVARIGAVLLALLAAYWAFGSFSATAQVKGNDNKISVVDECLPGDPGWNPTGGCTLDHNQGDVSFAEFNLLLRSPNTVPANEALIGHPAWRMEPSHITVAAGKTVRVKNEGGRGHTFTEVGNFGGGFVPPLNIGLTPVEQCNPQSTIPLNGGDSQELTGLTPGLHKFQCCIHPWMRATIRVE